MVVLGARSADQASRPALDRPRRTAFVSCPAYSSCTRATTASRSGWRPAIRSCVTVLVGYRAGRTARLLRHARLSPADLAADRHAPGRRPRQPARPRPHRLGHRLHPAAARLASVQPGRRLDRARCRAAAVRDRVARAREARRGPARRDAPFTIAYEDDHLLVVDKPAGPGRASCARASRGHAGAAARVRRGRWSRPQRAGIVHRLDRDTSGLLVVARSDEAHRRLQRALAERRDRAGVHRARPRSSTCTHRDDRGSDRTRPARAHAHGRRRRRSARSPHAFRDRALAGRVHAPAPAPGHRPHAPDPCPPAGDRPPRRGRSRVRAATAQPARLAYRHARSGAPVPARRAPVVRPSRSPPRRSTSRSPLPADLHAALEQAERLS